MLHTGAYWLLWSLRSLMPKRSTWRVAQFDTLRLRLVKLAARVVALKTRVMLHLPSACPTRPSCASRSSACRAWSAEHRGGCPGRALRTATRQPRDPHPAAGSAGGDRARPRNPPSQVGPPSAPPSALMNYAG